MPKSLAELEAAVRDARNAVVDGIKRYEESGGAPVETMELFGTINGKGDTLIDAYAAAVRELTWAKAMGVVESVRWDYDPAWMRVTDALTALRDAQERDK